MSWFPATILFVIACLAVAFGLCEWLIRRRSDGRNNDRDSLV